MKSILDVLLLAAPALPNGLDTLVKIDPGWVSGSGTAAACPALEGNPGRQEFSRQLSADASASTSTSGRPRTPQPPNYP